jgi:RNA polymerase sigma-70 factor, ECF subfamily
VTRQQREARRSNNLSKCLLESLPQLWTFALRLTADREIADRLVECACSQAMERGYQSTQALPERIWVLELVYSIWLKDRRFSAALAPRGNDLFIEQVGSRSEGDREKRSQSLRLLEMVDAMPTQERVVLILTIAEGLSPKDIAAVMSLKIGTVDPILMRAMEMIMEDHACPHSSTICTKLRRDAVNDPGRAPT